MSIELIECSEGRCCRLHQRLCRSSLKPHMDDPPPNHEKKRIQKAQKAEDLYAILGLQGESNCGGWSDGGARWSVGVAVRRTGLWRAR